MNTTTFKYILYFVIAAGTVVSGAEQPTSTWATVKLGIAAIVAGCVAIRAVASSPDGNAAAPAVPEIKSTSTLPAK